MAAIGCNGQEILRAHLAAIGCNGLTSQQFLSLPLKAQVEINVKFSDWKSQPLVYFNAYNLVVSRVFLKSAAWLELFFRFSFYLSFVTSLFEIGLDIHSQTPVR